MFLMDLPSIDRLLADVSRSLQADGKLIVTMTHPAFFSHTTVEDETGGAHYRRVTGYLQHEDRTISSFGGHHHYHRPLSWYIDQFAADNLAVTRFHEPPPPPPPSRSESYSRWFATVPTMLGLVAQPRPASRASRMSVGAGGWSAVILAEDHVPEALIVADIGKLGGRQELLACLIC